MSINVVYCLIGFQRIDGVFSNQLSLQRINRWKDFRACQGATTFRWRPCLYPRLHCAHCGWWQHAGGSRCDHQKPTCSWDLSPEVALWNKLQMQLNQIDWWLFDSWSQSVDITWHHTNRSLPSRSWAFRNIPFCDPAHLDPADWPSTNMIYRFTHEFTTSCTIWSTCDDFGPGPISRVCMEVVSARRQGLSGSGDQKASDAADYDSDTSKKAHEKGLWRIMKDLYYVFLIMKSLWSNFIQIIIWSCSQ